MGLFGLGSKVGDRCIATPDGNLECIKFNSDGRNKMTTGSRIRINVEPNSCVASLDLRDGADLLEEDEEWANKKLRQAEAACRGGIQ